MSDDHASYVEIGQLMQQVYDLKAECRRHAGNVVEVFAYATKCARHIRHIRGCAFDANRSCQCRASVAERFPEYADGGLTGVREG